MALPVADQIAAIVKTHIVPELVDNIYKSNVLFHRLHQKQKVVKNFGRGTIQLPIVTAKEAAVGTYSKFGILSTTPTDSFNAAQLTMAHYYGQLIIAEQELANSKGEGTDAVIDLLEAKRQNVELTMFDSIGTDLYTGDGTDPDALVGLVSIISAASAYAGIAPADLADWVAGYIDATATALSALTILQIKKAIGGLTIGTDRPTMGVTTQAVYDKIWSLIVTNERYVGEAKRVSVGGWEAIEIGGVPIFVDQHLPTGLFVAAKDSIIFLNENYLKFYIQSGYNFDPEPLPPPKDQDIHITRLRFFAQLATNKRKAHGAITNIDPTA